MFEGDYPVPARPHDHCRCTIVTHSGSSGQYCQRDHNVVMELRESGVDYSPPVSGDPTEITFDFEGEVLCRNGEIISVSFSLNFDGAKLEELKALSEDDEEAALGVVQTDAENRALEIAGSECRACVSPSDSMA